MNTYQRLTSSSSRRENGYACESEITGVLKGLGFTEEEFCKTSRYSLRRPEDPCLSRKTAPHKAGYSAFGRANQPSGFKFHRMAGDLSSELSTGQLLIVSHDRYFLNRVVTKVVEIEQGQAYHFHGQLYRLCAKKKAMLREAQTESVSESAAGDQASGSSHCKSSGPSTVKNPSSVQKAVRKCWIR